jgi:hypothetical protein
MHSQRIMQMLRAPAARDKGYVGPLCWRILSIWYTIQNYDHMLTGNIIANLGRLYITAVLSSREYHDKLWFIVSLL